MKSFFLGNSITDYCDWYELFGKLNIKNREIGGDGVIDRLDEVTSSKPKQIFLMIGINDLGKKRSVNQILTDSSFPHFSSPIIGHVK